MTTSTRDASVEARRFGRGLMGAASEAVRAEAIEARVDQLDWAGVHADLDAQGWAIAPALLTDAEADLISSLYRQPEGFRSQVVMSRHGFGRGEYKYFSYPLPPLIQSLAHGRLPPPRAHRQPLVRADGSDRALPAGACRLPATLPRGGPAPANALAPRVWPGRLQLPAS